MVGFVSVGGEPWGRGGGMMVRMRSVRRVAVCLALAAGLVWLGGCGEERSPGSAGAGKPVVAVSIYPVANLVEQMVGEAAEVVCLLPPGQSPHAFEPGASQMNALSRARLVVTVGLGLDHWVEQAARAAGRSEAVMFVAGDRLGLADGDGPADAHADDHADHEAAEHHEPGDEGGHDHDEHHDHETHDGRHDQGNDHGHAHGPNDPHIWLDPVLMERLVAGPLADALAAALPEASEQIRARAAALADELRAMHRAFEERLAPFAGQGIVTYHSAFDRLAARYGLRVAATLSPIETPAGVTLASLRQAVAAIREQAIRTVFTEPQFNPEALRPLRDQVDVRTLVLDPLGDPYDEQRATYQALMRYNVRTLAAGLSPAEAE